MSAPKPHIKPKADPYRQQTEPSRRDVPPDAEWDPPVFAERAQDGERSLPERVIFHEDDCLR